MLTDTTTIRHLARRLRDRAEEVRAEAGVLRRRADDVPWQGRAATAMRAHVTERLATLAATAGLHDDAADALDRHADAVDLAASVLGAAAGVAGAAAGAVEGAVDGAVDAAAHVVGALR